MALTWFKHDVRARGDPCFSPLLARHGMAGYGVYWALVEIAHDEGPLLDLSDDDVMAGTAHSLDMTAEQLEAFIGDCCRWGLFDVDRWTDRRVLTSRRICKQVEAYEAQCERNAANIRKRWPVKEDTSA